MYEYYSAVITFHMENGKTETVEFIQPSDETFENVTQFITHINDMIRIKNMIFKEQIFGNKYIYFAKDDISYYTIEAKYNS